MRVAVVGAGVLGASLASQLAARGADVTLVEADAPGSGTSSRGAGLVCEGMWHATSLHLVRRSMDLLDELAAHPGPFRFQRVGSTTLIPAALVGAARKMAEFQRGCGATVREVAPDAVDDLPRHGDIDVEGAALALHYPRDGWALPRLYAELLSYQLKTDGRSRVVRGAATLARDPARGRVEVRVDGAPVAADAVALAAGVHTRALLRQAGLDAPLLAYRTQAARITHARAADVPMLHDEVRGFYLRPGDPGHLVAGNGTTTTPEDITSWRASADEGFAALQLARVRGRFPFLADARSEDAWAGIDAATPDRLMLAGQHPGAPGVWLLAGGNGHGFMRAPAAGESLAALMLGDKPRVDLAAYDPARFGNDIAHSDFKIQEGYALE